MPAPINRFKQELLAGRTQIGLWLAMASAYSAEMASHAGFEWLAIDGEHAPNDVQSILGQLQAIQPSASSAVVRLPMGESWLIKQMLDIGAQTLLIPMVESADEARRLVAATRYAPAGTRGIGAALARASRFNGIGDYIATAGDQICLLVQVETRAGIDAIEALTDVENLDGIFVGPSDLAADMGYPGQPTHPDVVSTVIEAIRRIRQGGKAPGILSSDPAFLSAALDAGAQFVAVGTDVGLFTGALRELRGRYPAP